MDEKALLEIINKLRDQIIEIKGQMQKHQDEIDELEAAHENEKNLIEEKHQEEIGEYQYVISQQKGELDHLEHDNDVKAGKIGELENNLNQKDGELQNKIQELQTKTTEYNFLNERFNDKVNEIGILNEKLIKKEEELEKNSEESIRIHDKGNYNKVNIDTNDMNEEQKNYAIETTRNSLNTYSSRFQCAKYVKDQFETKFGKGWCVIIEINGCGDSCFTYFDKCYISFTMGEYSVEIAKTNLGDESLRLNDKGNYDKVDVITNKMSEDKKNFAIEKTRYGLKTYKNHSDCGQYVKSQLESQYGGKWCVILKPRGYGYSSFSYYDDCYIDFNMGEFFVNIFKSSWGDESIHLVNKGKYYEVSNIDNKMSDDVRTYAIETTRKSLNMYSDHFECTKYIKQQFESKYGGYWCVILKPRGYGSSNCTYYDDCYIDFYMGEFLVQIFKSSWGDESIHLNDKGKYYEVNVFTNTMSDDRKTYAIETTRKSLNMYSNHFKCAEYIKQQFESKYCGVWCVILMSRGYGDSSFTYYDDCYINFYMGEFDVTIFKSKI